MIVYDDRPTQELRPMLPGEDGPVSHGHEDWTPLRTGIATALIAIIAGSFISLFVLAAFIKPHNASPGFVFTAPPAELSTSASPASGMIPAPATYVAPTTQRTTPRRRPSPRPDPTRTTPKPHPSNTHLSGPTSSSPSSTSPSPRA